MKRAVIIHCWSGYPEYCWYQSVKRELETRGFHVEVPALPETDAPQLSLWLPMLTAVIGEPDEDLYLIGHSAGVITILRYLESLPEGIQIGGVVSIAGFTDDLGFAELKNFFMTPLDLAAIKERAKGFAIIASEDDPYVPLRHGNILHEALGGDLIVKHAMKHFSGPVDKEGSCVSLPDVLEMIEKLEKK